MINVLKGLKENGHKAYNNVNVIKMSKNGIVYIEDCAINRTHFIHIDRMPELKEFFSSMVGITDQYIGQYEKFINYYAHEDFINLKLHYERAYSQY